MSGATSIPITIACSPGGRRGATCASATLAGGSITSPRATRWSAARSRAVWIVRSARAITLPWSLTCATNLRDLSRCMTKLASIALVLVAAAGCKKHPAEAPATGSADGDAGPTNPADPSKPKPVTSAQISQRFEECWGFRSDGKWDAFKGCFANDAVYDLPGIGVPALSGTAAIIAAVEQHKTAFPDMKGATALELIHGHDVVAVTLVTGTNSGPMEMPDGDQPATNNKVGFFTSEVLTVDDVGHITHESEYLDTGTVLGQLHPSKDHPVRAIVSALPSPKEVVISANDDKENANLLADKTFIAAF